MKKCSAARSGQLLQSDSLVNGVRTPTDDFSLNPEGRRVPRIKYQLVNAFGASGAKTNSSGSGSMARNGSSLMYLWVSIALIR